MTNDMVEKWSLAIELAISQIYITFKDEGDYAITGSKALERYGLIPKRYTPEMNIVYHGEGVDFEQLMNFIAQTISTYALNNEKKVLFVQVSAGSTDGCVSYEFYIGGEELIVFKLDFIPKDEPITMIGYYHTPVEIFKGKRLCKTGFNKHVKDLEDAVEALKRAYMHGT